MKRKTWQYTQASSFRPTVESTWEEVARSADQVVGSGLWPVSVRVEVYRGADGWWRTITKFTVE